MSDEDRRIMQLIHKSKDPEKAANIAINIVLNEVKKNELLQGCASRNDRREAV